MGTRSSEPPRLVAVRSRGRGGSSVCDGVNAETSASGGTAELVPLPPPLAPSNPATQAWQQNIFRAGQIVLVSVTGILAFYP